MFVIFAVLFFVFFTAACYKSEDVQPPAERKYFNIQIKYERPPGSILAPDEVDTVVAVTVFEGTNCRNCRRFNFEFWDMIDDYHSDWSEPQLMPDNEDSSNYLIYCMYGQDWARRDGVQNNTIIVGDIFYIRVQETGFTKRLTNIIQIGYARKVLWRLLKDGTITDD